MSSWLAALKLPSLAELGAMDEWARGWLLDCCAAREEVARELVAAGDLAGWVIAVDPYRPGWAEFRHPDGRVRPVREVPHPLLKGSDPMSGNGITPLADPLGSRSGARPAADYLGLARVAEEAECEDKGPPTLAEALEGLREQLNKLEHGELEQLYVALGSERAVEGESLAKSAAGPHDRVDLLYDRICAMNRQVQSIRRQVDYAATRVDLLGGPSPNELARKAAG